MNTGSGDRKMNRLRRREQEKQQTLKKRLQNFLIRLWIPMLLLVSIALTVLGWYAVHYNKLSRNVKTTSQFSLDFKKNLDLKMYYFSVGNRLQPELPIEDVDQALELVESLESTTSKKESRKALENLRAYCENLRGKMFTLADTEGYDSRQLQLENNIKILTRLIQDEMHTYIHYETVYLAQTEGKLLDSIWGVMAVLIVFALGMILILLREGVRFSEEISTPISRICDNIKQVGNGRFHIEPVQTSDYETGVLNEGVQTMSKRIEEFIEKEKQGQEQKRLREFQLLQAQINPHFLYNTMDMINWMALQGQTSEISSAVQSLSRFYKLTLSRKKSISTIGEEEEHVSIYLKIQNMRYHDNISFISDIPDELTDYQIPKLTLQPVIENCVLHGILEKDTKAGTIVLTGWMEQEDIVLLISDDGVGIPPEKLSTIISGNSAGSSSGGTNIAVYNTHQRLQILYGRAYGLTYTSRQGQGTEVQIRIPARRQTQEPV